MIDQIFLCFAIFIIVVSVWFVLRVIWCEDEEREVYKLVKKDMLDPEMGWSGSGSCLKNHTKDYTYNGWQNTISFHSVYEDKYADYEVKLSKSENVKLGILAENIMVRKLLENKS